MMVVSVAEISAKYEDIFRRYEDIPEDIIVRVFSDERGRVNDYATPLRLGKEWLFEFVTQHQPRTAKVLLSGGPLMFVRHRFEDTAMHALLTEVNGAVVEIGRNFWGRNPDDPGYADLIRHINARLTERWGKPMTAEERHLCFPEPIRKAYYHRIDGLNVPRAVPWGIVYRLLPRPTNGWESIGNFLAELKLKKKYMPLIEERIPGVKELEQSGDPASFMMFLDARPGASGRDGDVLFVKNHIHDGVIYLISNGDVPNMMILDDPVTALDCYCEHILLRKEERFDFRQYALPM